MTPLDTYTDAVEDWAVTPGSVVRGRTVVATRAALRLASLDLARTYEAAWRQMVAAHTAGAGVADAVAAVVAARYALAARVLGRRAA